MRYSLSKLLLAVTITAYACALALYLYRSYQWASAFVILIELLLAAAAIWAIDLRGRARAIALAFSFVGIAYLIVATTDIAELIRQIIPTNHLLAVTWKWLAHPVRESGVNPATVQSSPLRPPIARLQQIPMSFDDILWEGTHHSPNSGLNLFFLLGHHVWALIFALLAGWVAAVIYSHRASCGPKTIA